ncbi:MAG: hypothetical protein ACO3SP_08495 [Ilumatobacteraceae bacterium]
MLEPSSATIRLFLHVLSATIWVGGQIVLAALVPALRRHDATVTKIAARAFNRLAWPAFAVLVVTGLWSLLAVDIGATDWDYRVTTMIHVLMAVVAGCAAAVHSFGRGKVALAVGGAVGLVASLAALFLGLVLRTGT